MKLKSDITITRHLNRAGAACLAIVLLIAARSVGLRARWV